VRRLMDGNAAPPRVREDDGPGAGMIPADRIVPDAIAGAEGDPTLGDVPSRSAGSTRTATPTAGLLANRARLGWRTLAADRARILATIAVVAIAAGGLLHVVGAGDLGHEVWRAAVALLAAELTFEVARTVVVDRHLGVDTIALVAMVGALALGEELAGAVIGLMFSGGAALEAAASKRARRELTALVSRAPRVAQLRVGGELREVDVDAIEVGDVVLVRTGEVVPVDGAVAGDQAVIDTSTLTGEPLPVTLGHGEHVLSGTANAGAPFEVRAERPAVESAYAALVRLVEQAERERAPFVRMADRYAGIFLPITLVVSALAWALSGDPVRGLAVVVVATPCPLILAAPIALVSGLSRAAKAGIVVKGPAAIETLGRARTVLFDKTGTVTVGVPDVQEIVTLDGRQPGEALQLAASVDRLSAHVLGEALVRAAHDAELDLLPVTHICEEPGQGIAGDIGGHRVAVGSRAFLAAQNYDAADVAGGSLAVGRGSGEAQVLVGIDGRLAAVIVMADEVRPDAEKIVDRLRAEAVRHVAMVSGDRRSVAERIGRQLGVDRVYAEQSPEDKLEVVRTLRADTSLAPVVMVGDGVNDAPALALADLGIAMGTAGATVSSQTADAVITVDRVDRVADAVHTGRRALRIARQSVLAGMGLSIAAMGVGAAGYLPPVAGALLQELVDLAVILNALRALRG
jgi:heavy metal translocating P-type ATPase